MSKVLVTKEKLDDLASHISVKSGKNLPLTIDEMTDTVDDLTASDLVSGSQTIIDDGIYDVTDLANVDVKVHSSKVKLIASGHVRVSTTNTSTATAVTIRCPTQLLLTKNNLIYVRIRGRSGKRNGYFYGSDAIFCNPYPANGSTTTFSSAAVEYIRVKDNGEYLSSSGSYGVYAYSISDSGDVLIRQRYSSGTLTINDTFDIEIYAISLPGGKVVFD